jgi:hypothetical protein
MKKIFIMFLFVPFFYNCATISKNTETLDEWGAYSVPPSSINTTGEIIIRTAPYPDGAQCIVYYDPSLSADSSYYFAMLMQDFGWVRNTRGGWSGNGITLARETKEGTMYVNPSKKVAIYIFPGYDIITYYVFRVDVIHN